MRVSALVPVRDAEATLADALGDLLAQTRPLDEIVVVDDGSTDASAAIASRFPVTVIRGPARGIVHALNCGLAACSGDLVLRMDADDRCAPARLERQLAVITADPSLAVVDARVAIFRDDGPVGEGMARYAAWMNAVVSPEDFDRELLVESPIAHPAALYRRERVRAVGGYREGPFPEDYDLWLRLHAAGARFAKVPEVLVSWRDHDRRLTRTDPRYGREGLRRARQAWLVARGLPRRVLVIGGGREGGAWVRWLRGAGCEVAVIDVHPRAQKGGAPVYGPDAIATIEVDAALVAVGVRGARDQIRGWLAAARPAWREGRDWWAVA